MDAQRAEPAWFVPKNGGWLRALLVAAALAEAGSACKRPAPLDSSLGRMDRSPPESALAGAGDTYDVVLNLAVPSAYELNFSALLTDITPERFAKVVQPALLDTLNQISPPSQRQTDLEILRSGVLT